MHQASVLGACQRLPHADHYRDHPQALLARQREAHDAGHGEEGSAFARETTLVDHRDPGVFEDPGDDGLLNEPVGVLGREVLEPLVEGEDETELPVLRLGG